MQGLRYDDYLLWAAMVLLLAYTGNTIAAVYHGLGYPAADMNWETFLKLMPYFFAYPALLTFSLLFSKAAVAAFLAILVIKRTHKAILWGSLGVLCLLSVLEFIGLFVQCFPVQANWDLTLDKNCHFNSTTVGYLLTGYGAFLDFFFAALPWIFFSKLRMDRKDKLTVCIALSAGVFAGICGIIRLVELYKFQKTRPGRQSPRMPYELCIT
ncbi:Nn.00g024270.m01.CDS01 [Neocucurbitaria sp. VM-36]